MTYYDGRDLHTYDRLARDQLICDHWFAAFPGGTWPNRWTTLGGSTPELDNLEPDDDRIGFLTGSTIFDLLTQREIDWRVFESDLSLVRSYDRLRLNVSHVLPYEDKREPSLGFEALARAGRLPAVTFVEPNFRDIPPLSTANDDLAPADLTRGPNFVARVYDALHASPAWGRTLLLVTYDEHGGFYDHVAPPGTARAPAPAELAPIPRIHPSAPAHLGVRVPAIVASPFVARGGVCKEIFDHTTIIKTILLRHRQRLPPADFTRFGPRVCWAADLGLALSQAIPPIEGQVTALRRPPAPAPKQGFARNPAERSEIHRILQAGFLPRRRR